MRHPALWFNSLDFLIPAAVMLGIFYLAVGLIKNDSYCRLALVIYSAMFFLVGIVVPITGLFFMKGHSSLVLIWPVPNPGVIHYALFFSIYLVFFGIPLWLLVRKPTATLFSQATHKTA